MWCLQWLKDCFCRSEPECRIFYFYCWKWATKERRHFKVIILHLCIADYYWIEQLEHSAFLLFPTCSRNCTILFCLFMIILLSSAEEWKRKGTNPLEVSGWTEWTHGLESWWWSANCKKSRKYFQGEEVVRQRFCWRGLGSNSFLGNFGGFHLYGFKISILEWVLGKKSYVQAL